MKITDLPNGVCQFSDIEPHLLHTRNIVKIPQNAKSVICFLLPYYLGEQNYKDRNISRYAVVPDYHVVCMGLLTKYCDELKTLHPDFDFVPFVDNSPLPEVFTAVNCGLGFVGKNGLLINAVYGSYCFIGEIVTDMMIPPTEKCTLQCKNCGLCEKNCPEKALKDGKVNTMLCLSSVTQTKKELTENQINAIENTGIIWGCDLCQELCPHNKNIPLTPILEFFDNKISTVTENTDISGRAWEWRGQKVIDRNLKIIKN